MLSHYQKTVIALTVIVLQSALVWRSNVALALAQSDLEEHTTDLSVFGEDTGDLENSQNCTDIHDTDIVIKNSTAFGKYKCEAKNELGTISREIQLREGTKPDPPSRFQLRGVNSDTLDIDVGATKSHDVDPDHSTIIGYRFEMIPTEEFAKHRNWDRAHRRDFDVEDGVTYLLVNLIPDTRYLIRVAARNAAGLSDWTEVKEFTTHPLQPHGFNSGAAGPDTGTLLLLRLLTALGSILLSTVVKLKF